MTLFLDFVGFGMILPILPYFAEAYDATPEQVTLLATMFSLAQFVMSPILGRLSDRYGRRPVMLLSIAGAIGSSLVVGVATSLAMIFLGRLLAGVCKANMSTAHAIVADVVAPQHRARFMGLMGAALGMGFVFGPAIGGELSLESFPTLPFFVSAGLSLINLIFAAIWLPETLALEHRQRAARVHQTGAQGSRLDQLKRISGTPMALLLGVCLFFFISFSLMESIFALYNERLWHWGARETGRFLGYIGIVVAVVQGGVVPRLLPRIGEGRSLAWGLCSMALGLGILALAAHGERWLGLPLGEGDGTLSAFGLAYYMVGGLCLAGGNAIVMASSSVLVSLLSSPESQGLNMGLRESASAVGRIVGPLIGGVLFGAIEPAAPMWLAAVLCGGNVILALRLRTRLQEHGHGEHPLIETASAVNR